MADLRRRRRSLAALLSLACVTGGVAAGGCHARPAAPAGGAAAGATNSGAGPGAAAAGDDEAEFQPPSPDWVTVYDPRRAWNGYTLTLLDARVPALLDMNGRPVHLWPAARVKSRIRLLPDGSILGIGLGRQVVEYDWQGRLSWAFRTPDAIPHHDVVRCADGHTLVLVLVDGEGADTIYEVTPQGRVAWTWRAAEHAGELFRRPPEHPEDVTHINSMQELPPNPWFAAGDRRFRPGNLLLSARNLNTIFVVERPSGRVVWSWTDGLDRQHEALMNGGGAVGGTAGGAGAVGQAAGGAGAVGGTAGGAGLIALFNNRPGSFWGNHQSELLQIDPRPAAVVWRYSTPGFFSPTGGSQQVLPNGNVLITSTRGGRVFEVTPAGEPVWEWAPPYEPIRAVRVGARACPQLARLPTPPIHPIAFAASRRHVDPDAYRFARQGSRMEVEMDGVTHTVLKEESDCRDLFLPAEARLMIGYGVDRARLRAAGHGAQLPRFVVTVQPAGAPKETEIWRDTVGAAGAPTWRERTLPLGAYSLRAVEICLEVEGGSPDDAPLAARFAYWEQPDIAGRDPGPRANDDADGNGAGRRLSAEELEVRRKHLRALGYVN